MLTLRHYQPPTLASLDRPIRCVRWASCATVSTAAISTLSKIQKACKLLLDHFGFRRTCFRPGLYNLRFRTICGRLTLSLALPRAARADPCKRGALMLAARGCCIPCTLAAQRASAHASAHARTLRPRRPPSPFLRGCLSERTPGALTVARHFWTARCPRPRRARRGAAPASRARDGARQHASTSARAC